MNIVMVTRALGGAKLVISKYAPEILMGIGITAGVGATATAVHATLKGDISGQVEAYKDTLTRIDDTKARYEAEHPDEDFRKEVAVGKIQASVIFTRGFLKTYALPITLTAVSVGALLWSRGIYAGRNAALTVALTGAQDRIAAYRNRVREEVGPDKEEELYESAWRMDVSEEDLELNNVPEDLVFSPSDPYVYVDYGEWASSAYGRREAQMYMLKTFENWANDYLVHTGSLFLNDVLQQIGLERTSEGQLLGWIYDQDNQRKVDFGFNRPGMDVKIADYISGVSDTMPLSFNVDGVVFDLI